MKRIRVAVFAALALAFLLQADTTGDRESRNLYYRLDNGLQVILDSRPGLPLVHVVFGIGIGSRDEAEGQNGMVHLLEHVMLLGGTREIPPEGFSELLRRNGVYFNAHTDADLMTLEFTLTPGHLKEVMRMAREKLTAVSFTEEVVEREKKAIVEEINQIEDDPLTLGRQLIFARLFAGHPYARPVVGQREDIEKTDAATLEAMYRKHFVPGNMSLAITGGLEIGQSREIIAEFFSDLPADRECRRELLKPEKPVRTEELKQEMDVDGHHLFLAFLAPSLNDEAHLPFDMAAQIFGRGYNPMLRSVLRSSGRLIVESVTATFLTMDLAGVYLIHIRCEEDKIKRIKREIQQFFNAAARMPFALADIPPNQRRGASDHLQNALIHLKMVYHAFQENGLSLASAYARSLLMQKESHEDDYLTRLSRLKSRDLNRVIDSYLSGEKYVALVIGPGEGGK